MISTAHALIGVSRHLSAYAMSPERAELDAVEYAGQILELATRLRGSGVSKVERVLALAVDAGISKRRAINELLPILDMLDLVNLELDTQRNIQAVYERIPPEQTLFEMADSILDTIHPGDEERAVLAVLVETIQMPVTYSTAFETATRIAGESRAQHVIDLLDSLNLVFVQTADDGTRVVFNPNIWSTDKDYSAAALRAEDGAARAALSGLIEEVSKSAGLPEENVTSCDAYWVNFAVAHGLVQRSLVSTTSGVKKAFLFVPHMNRSPFETPVEADPSGHVRQLISSMVYAKSYAKFNLISPVAFLNRLISDGEAGDTSSIESDYPMLETAGIVRVEPANKYYKLVLLQTDVAEQARNYLIDAGGLNAPGGYTVRDQSRYQTPEFQRAQLANMARQSSESQARIIAALRQEFRRK